MYSNGRDLVACGLFDEEGGQRTEDKCLDAAAEPVEVQAGDGRDTDSQPGVLCAQIGDNGQDAQDGHDDAQDLEQGLGNLLADEEQDDASHSDDRCNHQAGAQSAEQCIVSSSQCAVDQSADDGAGEDVAEMTASHGDGGEAFGHHIDGCHHEDGIQEAFQICAEACGLDLVVGDQNEHHQSPSQLGHQVSGGGPEADEADEVGHHGADEDGADQRDVLFSNRLLISSLNSIGSSTSTFSPIANI